MMSPLSIPFRHGATSSSLPAVRRGERSQILRRRTRLGADFLSRKPCVALAITPVVPSMTGPP